MVQNIDILPQLAIFIEDLFLPSWQAAEVDDARMLRELFDGGAGVMSALDHGKIEGANNPEALHIDKEAARVARRAAEALRASRAACQVWHAADRPS